MANKLPLATLIELAQSKTDEATRRLGQLQSAHTSAAGKLEMLLQYRQEYLDKLQAQMRDGLGSAQLRNFQNFIGTLDGAIEQQRALTLQADTRLAHGRGDWQYTKRRLNSFGTLADRVRQQEMICLNKREQRDNDERTARQFYLPGSALIIVALLPFIEGDHFLLANPVRQSAKGIEAAFGVLPVATPMRESGIGL